MPATSEIFTLIASMTQEERNGFVKHSSALSNRTSPLYLTLFEVFLRTENGTDQEVLVLLSNYPQIKSKLPWYKQHLEDKIVSYLNETVSNTDPFIQMKRLLSEALVMVDRRLLKLADKRLARAERIAIQYDDALVKLEIAEIRRRMSRLAPTRQTPDFIQYYAEVVDNELSKVGSTYSWGRMLVKQNVRIKEAVSEKDILVRKNIIGEVRDLVSNMDVPALSFESKISEAFLKMRVNEISGELDKAYDYAHETLLLYEERPYVKSQSRYGYLNALTNYLNFCFQSRKVNLIPEWLSVLEKAPVQNLWDEADRFSYWIEFKIVYHMNVWDFETASSVSGELEKGIALYGDKLKTSTLFSVVQNLLLSFLPLSRFSDARKWIHRIRDKAENAPRNTFYGFILVYEFIIDYELNDFELMESHYRSIHRRFRKKESLQQFEIQIIKTLMSMSRESKDSKKRALLFGLKSKLQEFRKEYGRKQPFGIIEFSWWVDNRLGLVGMPGQ